MDLQQMNTICPICLDTFKNPYSIGCSHLFCKICIDKWLDGRIDRLVLSEFLI